jgi:hypothetical protein
MRKFAPADTIKWVTQDDYKWKCSICGKPSFVDLLEKGEKLGNRFPCFEHYSIMLLNEKNIINAGKIRHSR